MAPSALHALLIGIDEYATGSGVASLRGCTNDARALRDRILSHRQDTQCTLLLNQEATRARLIQEMTTLRTRARRDDLVWIHYSGHGSTTRSPTPENPSAMDESLVLWESRTAGGSDLRDKEFGVLLAAIAATGAQVVVFLDCCHAGGQTRSAAAPAVRACPPDLRQTIATGQPEVASSLHTENGLSSFVFQSSPGQDALEGVTVIAACGDDEKAAEILPSAGEGGRWHGAATWYLLRALDTSESGTTWAQIHASIYAGVRARYARQSPQLIGPGDRLIFGGVGTTHTATLAVLAVSREAGKRRVQVSGGLAVGVGIGARLALYNVASPGKGKPLAFATVESAEIDSAWASLDDPAAGEIPEDARAIVVAYGYDTARLKIHFAEPAVLAALQQSNTALLEPTEIAEAEVWVQRNETGLLLSDSVGNNLIGRAFHDDDSGVGLLLQALNQIAVYRNVERLQNRSVMPALRYALDISPPVALSPSRSSLKASLDSKPLPRIAAGDWQVQSGKRIAISVTNRSNAKCYVTALALLPDWSIAPVKVAGSPQTTLAPGRSLQIEYRTVLPSDANQGRMLFKIFVTTDRVDFSSLVLPPLLEGALTTPTRNAGSLGWLLDALRRTGTRPVRPVLSANADDKWFVHDIPLVVE